MRAHILASLLLLAPFLFLPPSASLIGCSPACRPFLRRLGFDAWKLGCFHFGIFLRIRKRRAYPNSAGLGEILRPPCLATVRDSSRAWARVGLGLDRRGGSQLRPARLGRGFFLQDFWGRRRISCFFPRAMASVAPVQLYLGILC